MNGYEINGILNLEIGNDENKVKFYEGMFKNVKVFILDVFKIDMNDKISEEIVFRVY